MGVALAEVEDIEVIAFPQMEAETIAAVDVPHHLREWGPLGLRVRQRFAGLGDQAPIDEVALRVPGERQAEAVEISLVGGDGVTELVDRRVGFSCWYGHVPLLNSLSLGWHGES